MKRKNPICAYKRLLANDHDWDYGYLIALEKKKLQRMHNYMKHEGHLENNDIVVRDIGICILTWSHYFEILKCNQFFHAGVHRSTFLKIYDV